MTKIKDLIGISQKKRNQIVKCLEELLAYKDSQGKVSPIITGYNWYPTLTESVRIITFFHIHETEDYKQDMLQDLNRLGYSPQASLKQIRNKGGAFLWDLDFEIRNKKGDILHGLKIKDIRTSQYINL